MKFTGATVSAGPTGEADVAISTSGGVVGYAPLQIAHTAANGNITPTFGSAPAATSTLFALIGKASGGYISGITQTNVAWSKLHGSTASPSVAVEVWAGIPSGGTPGTAVAITVSAGYTEATVVEMPKAAALSGVLDQYADASLSGPGSTTPPLVGPIVPSTSKAVVFAVFAESDGSQLLSLPIGVVPLMTGETGISECGYAWPGQTPISAFLYAYNGGAALTQTIVSVT
jgi:hypothetical protein